MDNSAVDNSKKIWFKNKKYGYGWTPYSKEGWLVTIACIIGLLLNIFLLAENYPIISFITSILIVSILIIVCYIKGEKLKWQWDGKQSK